MKPGNEGIGPLAGDAIDAMYRFKSGASGYFATHRGKGNRFGLTIFGSKGVIKLPSGYASPAWILKDPIWSPGKSGQKWLPISSAGVNQPEPLKVQGYGGGNPVAVADLIEAIEQDRQPKSNMYDARAATEMIIAVFESHRVGGPVSFPLENRKHPLDMLPA